MVQWQVQIKVSLLGLENILPPAAASLGLLEHSLGLSPVRGRLGVSSKVSEWRFSSPSWIAGALGLDIIGRVAETDGIGKPPIDLDKAFGGEAYTWPFCIGTTTHNMHGHADNVGLPGVLRLTHVLVNQYLQQRGQCITNLVSTGCPPHQRISETVTVRGPAGTFATYKFPFLIEQWPVYIHS